MRCKKMQICMQRWDAIVQFLGFYIRQLYQYKILHSKSSFQLPKVPFCILMHIKLNLKSINVYLSDR